MWTPARKPINNPLVPWEEAIDQAGAAQMQHGRALIESRPFLTRVPDPEIIVTGNVPTSVPRSGRGTSSLQRAMGTYAMVYAPVGRPFAVKMSVIAGPKVKAWWFNPRTGAAAALGTFANTGEQTFTPPDRGELLDWVLVLDDDSKRYSTTRRSVVAGLKSRATLSSTARSARVAAAPNTSTFATMTG